TDPRTRPADLGRLPSGRAAAGQSMAVELARPRRHQRPRARSQGLSPGNARGRGRRRLRPARPAASLYAPLPAGAPRRRARRHPRSARRLPEGAGGPMTRPRVGFLGVGWIGRHRMQAILDTGAVEAAAIADSSPAMAAEAARLAPGARLVDTRDAMLAMGLDGVAIATPSALHAEQSILALRRGAAVF